MTANLRSRLKLLERNRSSGKPILLISCGEHPTPDQLDEGHRARKDGRKVIFVINGDQFDDAIDRTVELPRPNS